VRRKINKLCIKKIKIYDISPQIWLKKPKEEKHVGLEKDEELGMACLPNSTLVEILSYLLLHHKGTRVLWMRVRGIVAQIPM